MATIDILRTGKFLSASGETVAITDEVLQDVVATFDPKIFNPPLIISHDTNGVADKDLAESELAHGTPSRLERVGNCVRAVIDNVSEAVKNWFASGQLLSVSPSLYPPEHPANPYPGRWVLRHIAALGKSPPAIKGLKIDLQEALDRGSNVDGVIDLPYNSTLPFNESDSRKQQNEPKDLERSNCQEIKTLQEVPKMTEEQEEQAAPTVSKDEALEALKNRIAQLENEKASLVAEFSEQKSALSEQSAKLDQIYAALQAQKQRLDEKERELEVQEISNFVEGLIRDKKMLVSDKERKITLLLAADNTKALDFGEGKTLTHRQALMEDLAERDVLPEFKEVAIANPEPPVKTAMAYLNFALPKNAEVSTEAERELQIVTNYMTANNIPPSQFSATLAKLRRGEL